MILYCVIGLFCLGWIGFAFALTILSNQVNTELKRKEVRKMDKEKRQRFQNAINASKNECCIGCPCAEGCDKIPEEDTTPCETILFLYVETGETENFEKFLTNT